MEKKFDPAALDVKAFAQTEGALEGASPLTQWTRLSLEQVPGDLQALVQMYQSGVVKGEEAPATVV